MTSTLPTSAVGTHPLDPLTAAEIAQAVEIIHRAKGLGETWRFASVVLHEPTKDVVLASEMEGRCPRQAFLVLLDNATGHTYEAIVDLTRAQVVAWQHIPGVQPRIMADEMAEGELAVKADPAFQAALAKRGLTVDQVMVDLWSVGHYGFADEVGVRLVRALIWFRETLTDNAYARSVDGLRVWVDLNQMRVWRLEDHTGAPLPPQPGNYAREYIPQWRTDLKPLEIRQPEGPSFTVEGWQVRWQKWQFRVGFTPREGLVLHQVIYEDDGRPRSVLYRASLAEMVVPYGDPRAPHYRNNAFDVGEYGVGMLANSLKLGCDCLGEIYYFDATLADSRGRVTVIENAVCMHEEDYGILWKHTNGRINQVEVRRSRRLVVSFITTVDNYEYGIFWYFYQDGSIQFEAKLTGIVLTAAAEPEEQPKYGVLVAPQVNALVHQHFFGMRLDFDLDGVGNSIEEVNTVAEPPGPENPQANAFYATTTLLKTEAEAQRLVDAHAARYWRIINPNRTNGLGTPVAYRLIPGENVLPFAHPESSLMQRAGFLAKHLWVTPYDPAEQWPAGPYPNQHPGGEGLPQWTQANRSLVNTDLVVWYNFGHHHIPRPEDWPVMPVAYSGFWMKPDGFFDRNPALDVPPSPPAQSHCCHS